MRRFQTWALVITLCGCHANQSARVPGREGALNKVDPNPKLDGVRRVAIGDSLVEASALLLASGAKDISRTVGIFTYAPDRLVWYELQDGTGLCICVTASDGMKETISSLTLGEPGRGYGDKIKWHGQRQREVKVIELQ